MEMKGFIEFGSDGEKQLIAISEIARIVSIPRGTLIYLKHSSEIIKTALLYEDILEIIRK